LGACFYETLLRGGGGDNYREGEGLSEAKKRRKWEKGTDFLRRCPKRRGGKFLTNAAVLTSERGAEGDRERA